MGAATNATRVWTGTPTYEKGIFFNQIQKSDNQKGTLEFRHSPRVYFGWSESSER